MTSEQLRMVLATRNRDKVLEIRAGLTDFAVEILSLEAFPQAPEVIEDGETLEANAAKKAVMIHEYTGLPALADDSGLFVAALHGAPGVYSNRYAGEQATYQDNVKKLLWEMRAVPAAARAAEFVSVMAFAHNGQVHLLRGVCPGSIAPAPRGEGQFGYDPVFIVAGRSRSFAEMTLAEKNIVSHRGLVLVEFKKLFLQLGLVKQEEKN